MWRLRAALRRTWVVNVGLSALVVAAVFAAVQVVGRDAAPAPEPTAVVRRGTVLATVSAAGQVVAPTDVGLDFAVAGRLTTMRVEVGQRVEAGQVLATVDDSDARGRRAAAEADVAAAQADLAAVVEGRTPGEVRISDAQIAQAAVGVDSAQVALSSAGETAAQNAALYDRQVAQEQERLQQRRDDLAFSVRNAEAALRQAEADRALLQQGLTPAQVEVNQERVAQAEAQVATAEAALEDARSVADATGGVLDEQVDAARGVLEQAENEAERARESRSAAEDDVQDAEDAQDEAQDALEAAQAAYDEACAPPVDLAEVIACDQAEEALQLAQTAYQQAASSAAQARTTADQADDAVAAADEAVARAEDDVDGAGANREQGLAQADQSVRQAETRLVEAQAAYDLTVAQTEQEAEPPTEAELAQATARVDQATVALRQAEAARPDTTALTGAERARDQGRLSDRASIEQAAAQVDSARTSLELASAEEQRNAEAPGDAEVAQAVSAVSRAEAQLQQVDDDLRDTVLRAPISGVVAAVNGEVGELVGAGADLSVADGAASSTASGVVVLTQVQGLLVEAEFTETDVLSVDVGQPATITLNAQPDRALTARVARIDPTATIEEDVVEYDVLLVLEAGDASLRPDQTTTVDVVIGAAEDALYLPAAAVQSQGNERTVTVVQEGQRAVRQVAVGVEGDETVEILSGLEEGEEVLLVTGAPSDPFETGEEAFGGQEGG